MMNTHYLAVWKLYGINTLASGATNLELARLNDPKIVATLATDPEPFFLHIDQARVIASQVLNGLLSSLAQQDTIEERLAIELKNVRTNRANQIGSGMFLIVKGETNVAEPNFEIRKDTETFAVCFDAIDKSAIKEIFRPSIQAVLTAITLSIPSDADHQIEPIGEVIYLVGADGKKPIYSFSLQMGSARLSLSSPLSAAALSNATKWIPRLVDYENLARPISLAVTSIDRTTDSLQGFLAAWSALEIFVNVTFKERYNSLWHDAMQTGAPDAARPIFRRINEVMSDKYRLTDKFLLIASLLNTGAAEADAREFGTLKKVRDNLLHGQPTAHLPTEAVHHLLFKYISLHLDRIKG